MPAGWRATELSLIYQKFVRDYPEWLRDPAAFAAFVSFWTSFPCVETESGVKPLRSIIK